MKLASYNVNGLRAALKKGLVPWVSDQNFDIICFQETKSQPEQVDLAKFESMGYHSYWHSAEKKGYSGVLTLSKSNADYVYKGMGKKIYDDEGRILRIDIGDLSLLNCYFPSGSSGEIRHEFKIKFLKDFKLFINNMIKERPNLIVVGDYNIVHGDLDIHNPERKDLPSGFRPEERKWLDVWFRNSFDDAFRKCHPHKQEFSWWSYRAGSRERNKGWRIDYISASKSISHLIKDAGHNNKAIHSDHCPVWAKFDFS